MLGACVLQCSWAVVIKKLFLCCRVMLMVWQYPSPAQQNYIALHCKKTFQSHDSACSSSPRHLSASVRRATGPVGNRRWRAAPILAGGLPRRLGPSSPPSHPQSLGRLPCLQPRRRIPSPRATVSRHVGTPPASASSALQPGRRQAWYEPRILLPSILFFLAKSLTLTFSDLI